MNAPFFLLLGTTLLACARTPVEHVAIDATVASVSSPSSSAPLRGASMALEDTYRDADVVVIGPLVQATRTTLETDPPQYVHSFQVVVDQRLSGAEVPPRFAVSFSSRTQDQPLPSGTPMALALRRIENSLPTRSTAFQAIRVDVATPELRSKLAFLSAAPAGLSLSIAQVPAATGSPGPHGDGVFELTLRNDGAAPVRVPGVSTKDTSDWSGAIEIHDEAGRTLRVRQAAPAAGAKPLELAPHSELVTTVDVKPFGVVQRVGGGRLTYSFGVGPVRTSSFFYYVDAYHGPMLGTHGVPPQQRTRSACEPTCLEKGLFLGGRAPAEQRIAVGKAAEAPNDVVMSARVRGVAETLVQPDGALLVLEPLGVREG